MLRRVEEKHFENITGTYANKARAEKSIKTAVVCSEYFSWVRSKSLLKKQTRPRKEDQARKLKHDRRIEKKGEENFPRKQTRKFVRMREKERNVQRASSVTRLNYQEMATPRRLVNISNLAEFILKALEIRIIFRNVFAIK